MEVLLRLKRPIAVHVDTQLVVAVSGICIPVPSNALCSAVEPNLIADERASRQAEQRTVQPVQIKPGELPSIVVVDQVHEPCVSKSNDTLARNDVPLMLKAALSPTPTDRLNVKVSLASGSVAEVSEVPTSKASAY